MSEDETDDALGIGRRIRQIRREKQMTLEEVARGAGLTRVSVSRIEAGRVNPSLASLKRIADTLGIFVGSLFVTEPEEGGAGAPPDTRAFTIVRRDRRKQIQAAWDNWFLDLSLPGAGRRFQVAVDTIDPGVERTHEDHDAEEFVLILEGSCELMVDRRPSLLEEGDCMYLRRPPLFTMRAAGATSTRVLWLSMPGPSA